MERVVHQPGSLPPVQKRFTKKDIPFEKRTSAKVSEYINKKGQFVILGRIYAFL